MYSVIPYGHHLISTLAFLLLKDTMLCLFVFFEARINPSDRVYNIVTLIMANKMLFAANFGILYYFCEGKIDLYSLWTYGADFRLCIMSSSLTVYRCSFFGKRSTLNFVIIFQFSYANYMLMKIHLY